MNSATEQLLGTLEVLGGYRTFLWETETQGEFNLWNLMITQGFASLTDLELAFEHWQNIERWGTATDQNALFYEYAPPRSEGNDETWNEASQQNARDTINNSSNFSPSICKIYKPTISAFPNPPIITLSGSIPTFGFPS